MDNLSRIQELKAYGILDTPPEKEFDDIVELAATICNTPIAQITLIDTSRQWIKSSRGLPAVESPRENSFCTCAIECPDGIFEVEDSLLDPRFVKNPNVTGAPFVRYYAGAPLKTPSGNVMGMLCVIDTVPKKISEDAKKSLGILARKVIEFFETRKRIGELKRELDRSISKLTEVTSDIEALRSRALAGSWSWHRGEEIQLSDEMNELLSHVIPGRPHPNSVIKDYGLFGIMRGIVRSAQEHIPQTVVHKFIKDDHNVVWLEVKLETTHDAAGVLNVNGSCVDITLRKKYHDLLEEILFTISHTIRRPVSTLQGLANLLVNLEVQSPETMKQYSNIIKSVIDELDTYTRYLTALFVSRR